MVRADGLIAKALANSEAIITLQPRPAGSTADETGHIFFGAGGRFIAIRGLLAGSLYFDPRRAQQSLTRATPLEPSRLTLRTGA
eukprot:scaffold1090_cov135-Isochrysis_galbana.AAC.3